jgi:hypothetical protein
MTVLYQETVLPIIEQQPGFKGIFVLTDAQTNKEVSITMWETKADMEAFNANLIPLADHFVPLLYEAPDVEIFEVSLPLNCKPEHEMFLSEASLGLHIVNPFDEEPTTIPV